MEYDDDERTVPVCTPEPGSWSERTPYTNPAEYTYYTHKLLQRRVADAVARCVLSTLGEEEKHELIVQGVARGYDPQTAAGSQHCVGETVDRASGGENAAVPRHPTQGMVRRIIRRRRADAPASGVHRATLSKTGGGEEDRRGVVEVHGPDVHSADAADLTQAGDSRDDAGDQGRRRSSVL